MPMCPDCADPLCRRFGCVSDQGFTTEEGTWVCPSCSETNENGRYHCTACGNRAPVQSMEATA